MSDPMRRAGNLLEYLERLVQRIGLGEGPVSVVATLHQGFVVKVSLKAENSFPSRVAGAGAAGGLGAFRRWDATGAGRPRPVVVVLSLLRQRLRRLLRGFAMPYGRLRFEFDGGKLLWVIPAPSLKPAGEELAVLSWFFET